MKTVVVGEWDGEHSEVSLEDTATVNDALHKAGYSLRSNQQITAYSNALRVNTDEIVSDGETYLITGSQISG